MTFPIVRHRNLRESGNANAWKEFLYAIFLFRQGINPTEREFKLISQTEIVIDAEMTIWRCRPVDNYDTAHRFSFRRTVDGQKYQIDKGDTSLLFISFQGPFEVGNMTVEAKPTKGRIDGLEIISTWGNDFNSDPNLMSYHPYLRAIVAEETGEKGILFPREQQYQVLKYSPTLSILGEEERRPDQYNFISLNEFILKSYQRLPG